MNFGGVDILNAYMQDIRGIPLLTKKEEEDCFKKYKAGDDEARNLLVEANQRFVVRVAKEYQNCGLTLIELISEGNIGLFEAVCRFDENRGFKFITYAVWWIKQSILKAIVQNPDTHRIPINRRSDLRICEETELQLGQVLGRNPTRYEIAEKLRYTLRRVEHAFETKVNDSFSLDQEYGDGDPAPLHAKVEDKEALDPNSYSEEMELTEAIQSILASLDGRNREIFLEYYGFNGKNLTLEQIGSIIGVTRERVRQIRDNKLEKIRQDFANRGLELSDFL